MFINLKKNHPVYESALVVMQCVQSLLVLQIAAYHGWGNAIPRGALCQIKVPQMLVGRGQARIFSATNAVFGKIGMVASEEVVLELVKCKCLPILLYGLECCPLNKSDIQELSYRKQIARQLHKH